MKVSDSVKKAMVKLKEVKAKSEDSGSRYDSIRWPSENPIQHILRGTGFFR